MNALKQIKNGNRLLSPGLLSNNRGLTKNSNTQCHALNMAFFVPKIHQAWYLLKGIKLDLGIKNEVRIPNSGRVKERNTIPIYLGNMFNRVRAVSNTRPPVTQTGGSTKNSNGGLPMPNTSKGAIICTIQAVHTTNGIKASIHTRYNQKATIGRLFSSIEQLQAFIQSQGLSLDLLGGRA